MGRILAVGNATLDIINVVDDYPREDQEVRASSQQFRRGGNAANTLVVLSQLGNDCSWAGTLADEPDAAMILADLDQHHIDYSAAHIAEHGKVPTSYISLSRLSGSRTIVHYRELPEYRFSDFSHIDLNTLDWLHFEGRNVNELKRMMAHARADQPNLLISLEVEKPRPNIEELFGYADLILFSKEYAIHNGSHDLDHFLNRMATQRLDATLSCTWGEKGASAVDNKGKLFHSPAFNPPLLVETLGAGDTFNAGMIDQILRGHSVEMALIEATRLAGKKCGRYGLEDLLI